MDKISDIEKILLLNFEFNNILYQYFNSNASIFKLKKLKKKDRRKISKKITQFRMLFQRIAHPTQFNSISKNFDVDTQIILLYKDLQDYCNSVGIDTTTKTIEFNRPENLNFSGSNLQKKLLNSLNRKMKDFSHFFEYGLLNGSIGSQDYKSGWSDIDIFLILNEKSFDNEECLQQTRNKIQELNEIIYNYQIYQLHGPFIALEYQFNFFSNHYFPISCVSSGLTYTSKSALIVNEISSYYNERQYFLSIVDDALSLYFRLKLKSLSIREKIRYIHRIYSFPFTYLQTSGIFTDKKESFNILESNNHELNFPEIVDFYKKINEFYLNWKPIGQLTAWIRGLLSKIFNIRILNLFFTTFEFRINSRINTYWRFLEEGKFLMDFTQYCKKGFTELNNQGFFQRSLNFKPYEDLNFYEFCINKIRQEFSLVSGIISIYQFGTIHAIGNSDIDLCFVIDEFNCSNDKIHEILVNKFTIEEQYLIYEHSPLILNKELFKKIQLIRPANSLTLISGQNLTYQKDIIKNDFAVKFILVIELFSTINNPFNPESGKILHETRLALQIMNAIKYPLILYHEVCKNLGEKPIIDKKITDYFLKRNTLFRKKNHIFSQEFFTNYLTYANDIYIHWINQIKFHLSNIIETRFLHDNEEIKNILTQNFQLKNKYFIQLKDLKKIVVQKTKLNKIKLEFLPTEFVPFLIPKYEVCLKNSKLKKMIKERRHIMLKYLEFTESQKYKRIYNPLYAYPMNPFSQIVSKRGIKECFLSHPIILFYARIIVVSFSRTLRSKIRILIKKLKK